MQTNGRNLRYKVNTEWVDHFIAYPRKSTIIFIPFFPIFLYRDFLTRRKNTKKSPISKEERHACTPFRLRNMHWIIF
jgi:hypothetical protein